MLSSSLTIDGYLLFVSGGAKQSMKNGSKNQRKWKRNTRIPSGDAWPSFLIIDESLGVASVATKF